MDETLKQVLTGLGIVLGGAILYLAFAWMNDKIDELIGFKERKDGETIE